MHTAIRREGAITIHSKAGVMFNLKPTPCDILPTPPMKKVVPGSELEASTLDTLDRFLNHHGAKTLMDGVKTYMIDGDKLAECQAALA